MKNQLGNRIDMEYHPIIIIGAARSGTNMLRDVLTDLSGVATWPCDEIPFVWRYGNASHSDDEFSPELARPAVRRYIRAAFGSIARRMGGTVVVEKTCANSLRVRFVDRVLPEAKYLYIVRDGRDAAASAMKRWVARLDLPYMLRKARFVPVSDLPYYGFKFVLNRLKKLLSKDGRMASWGPRFKGMQQAVAEMSLAEVCAIQWTRSMELSEAAFQSIPPERQHRIQYEAFVANPLAGLEGICDFIGLEVDRGSLEVAVADVRSDSVGKGRKNMAPEDLRAVESIQCRVLKNHGYHCRD